MSCLPICGTMISDPRCSSKSTNLYYRGGPQSGVGLCPTTGAPRSVFTMMTRLPSLRPILYRASIDMNDVPLSPAS